MPVPAPVKNDGLALIHFAGRAGDHNDRAMVGSRELAAALATRLGAEPVAVGSPEPALSMGWAEELAAAIPTLREMTERLDLVLREGLVPVTALSRCAVALATLPVVAACRPDAVVVWFDAHADLNTPESTSTGYLGGLAFSGPLGLWDTGLGAGLDTRNAILVGARGRAGRAGAPRRRHHPLGPGRARDGRRAAPARRRTAGLRAHRL